jgi:ABC-type spermidine/putrescine transport system permease subunit I
VGAVLPLRPAALVGVHAQHWAGKRLVIAMPYLWLLLFFLVPFLIVFKISFSETRIAMPPYAPLLAMGRRKGRHDQRLNFSNYAFLLTDDLYVSSYLYSVKVAAVLDAAVPAARLPDGLCDRAFQPDHCATCS